MSGILRAGVIGAGVFGGYHAAKYASLPGVRLVGVYDHHVAHAEALAARHGAQAFSDQAALIEAVDLVSIATPAVAHAPAALASLRSGKPVYVEKPIAATRGDAGEIVAEARAQGVAAACGFLERAALGAMGLMEVPERPLLLEAVRVGLPSPRNLDVSVALDLMIHDLDLALALGAGERRSLGASGSARSGQLLDEAAAEIAFDSGFVARFRASRIAGARERTMRLVFPSGEVRVDFLAHSFENTTPFRLDPDFEARPEAKDPLGASIGAFIAAVRGERPSPLASADDGARALDLALAVEQAAAA